MSSPAFTIRLLGPADADVLRDMDPDTFDHALDPDALAAVLGSPQQHLAVALMNHRVVGMATAVHYHRPDKPPTFYIDEVGVAKTYQRRGIGSALMAAMLEQARTLGCPQVWLMTEAENAPARAFYAHLGGVEEQQPPYITFDLSADTQTESSTALR
jgi:aminoglycoside 6'-N-acetyltransferase I